MKLVTCDTCGKRLGAREELVMKIRKGSRVEIIVTCAECLKPPERTADDFDIEALFGSLGIKGCNK